MNVAVPSVADVAPVFVKLAKFPDTVVVAVAPWLPASLGELGLLNSLEFSVPPTAPRSLGRETQCWGSGGLFGVGWIPVLALGEVSDLTIL